MEELSDKIFNSFVSIWVFTLSVKSVCLFFSRLCFYKKKIFFKLFCTWNIFEYFFKCNGKTIVLTQPLSPNEANGPHFETNFEFSFPFSLKKDAGGAYIGLCRDNVDSSAAIVDALGCRQRGVRKCVEEKGRVEGSFIRWNEFFLFKPIQSRP